MDELTPELIELKIALLKPLAIQTVDVWGRNQFLLCTPHLKRDEYRRSYGNCLDEWFNGEIKKLYDDEYITIDTNHLQDYWLYGITPKGVAFLNENSVFKV